MSVRLIVPDGVPLRDVLIDFNRRVDLCYRRSWHKRRFGYYEKPSVLHRRSKRLNARNSKNLRKRGKRVGMYMGLRTLHGREGGFP